MGQMDLREKLLEDYEDVFSDIFNGLVFEDNIIKQQYLRMSSTESIYKAENGFYKLINIQKSQLTFHRKYDIIYI